MEPPPGIDVRALRPFVADHEKRIVAIENLEIHINPVWINVIAPNSAGTGQTVISVPVCPTSGRVEVSGEKFTIVLG